MAVLVLAGSLREANAYGREKGFRVRFATGPEVVHAAKHIVELPSFRLRRDRFSMQQALQSRLRFGRGVQYEFADGWTYTRPTPVDQSPKPNPDASKPSRAELVTAFDAATEALAVDMQITAEELIRYTVDLLDRTPEVEGQEPLPASDDEPVVTPEPEPEVAPEPEPLPEPEPAPAKKRAPRKKAAVKPPVVDAPVEF
jgi:hypothetical protein